MLKQQTNGESYQPIAADNEKTQLENQRSIQQEKKTSGVSIPPDNTNSLATRKDDVRLATMLKAKKPSTGGRAMTTVKSKRKPSKKDGTTDKPNVEQDHQKLQKLSNNEARKTRYHT